MDLLMLEDDPVLQPEETATIVVRPWHLGWTKDKKSGGRTLTKLHI
jgi:hypothetical protein